jgi:hypothetical protein
MENKNIKTGSVSKNLLKDTEFQSLIKFESDYATTIKGGHLPTYYTKQQQLRLVNEVNFLTPLEKVQFVQGIFTSKN